MMRAVLIVQDGNETMSDILKPTDEPGRPAIFQIRVKGHLSSRWIEWFEGLTITLDDNGESILSGPVVDQAALHGLLNKVRDLGMPLVSVIEVEPERLEMAEGEP